MERRSFISIVLTFFGLGMRPKEANTNPRITPFWNQTSRSNLIAASRGIVDCATRRLGEQKFSWKIGADAKTAIFCTT